MSEAPATAIASATSLTALDVTVPEPETKPSVSFSNAATESEKATMLVVVQKTKKDFRFWSVIFALLVTTFLVALDLTAVSTALPTIANDLNGGSTFEWVGSSYSISATAFVSLSGSLSNIFGRRPVLIVSLILFSIGSAVSGSAQSMNALIAGRVLQGFGGGGIESLPGIIISDMLPVVERGPIMGLIGGVWALASAVGPVMSGALADAGQWRWLFYLNLPVCALSMALVIAFLNLKSKTEHIFVKLRRVDWIGNALVVGSTVSFLLGLTWGGSSYPWKSAQVLVPIIVGALGMGGFFIWESSKFVKEPTIPIYLFGNRTSVSGYLQTFIHGIVVLMLTYYLPLFLQACKGDSPTKSGIDMFGTAFVAAPMAIVAGIAITVVNKYWAICFAAWVFVVIGEAIFTTISWHRSIPYIQGMQVVLSVGVGMLYSTTMFPIVSSLPINATANALSFMIYTRALGQAVGIVIGSTVIQNQLAKNLPEEFVLMLGGSSQIAYAAAPYVKTLTQPLQQQVIAAFSKSVGVIWYVAIGLAVAGLIVTSWMKEIKMHVVTDENWGLDRKDQEVQEKTENVSNAV